MATIATLLINIEANTRLLRKGLAKAAKQVSKFTRKAGKQFLNLGASINNIGLMAAKAAVIGVAVLGAAIIGVGVASVKAAISMESAFAGVIKTVDGLVDETGDLTVAGEELQQGFRDLAKEIPTDIEELLRIGELGGQLGIAREDILRFTGTIARLGETTSLSVDEAALSLARLANIFGTSSEDFERLGATIVDLGNNIAATETDIVAYAERLGGIGKVAGLSEANVLAIGASFASVGVKAQRGSTAIQKALIGMTSAVAQGTGDTAELDAVMAATEQSMGDLARQISIAEQQQSEFTDSTKDSARAAKEFQLDKLNRQLEAQASLLEDLQSGFGAAVGDLEIFAETAGLTADEFQKAFKEDAAGAFASFITGLGRQGDDAFKTLEDLGLQDQRLISAFLSLAGAGDLVTQAIDRGNIAWEQGVALQEEAEKRFRTTESQMKLLKNTIRDVAFTIGGALLPFINDVVKDLRPFIDSIGEKLPKVLEDTLIPALKDVVKFLQKNVPIAIERAKSFFENTLVPAFEQIKMIWESTLKPTLMTIISFLQELLPKAIAFVVDNMDAFKTALLVIGAVLAGAAIASAIAGIASSLAFLISPIGLIIAAVALLAIAWQRDFGGIRTVLTEVFENTIKPALMELARIFETRVLPVLKDVGTFFTTVFLPAVQRVFMWIQENVFPIVRAFIDFFIKSLVTEINILVTVFTQFLLPALSAVFKFLGEKLAPVFQFLGDTVLPIVEQAFSAIGDSLKTLSQLTGFLGDFFDDLDVPDIFKPGSPTPLEEGMIGVGTAMKVASNEAKTLGSVMATMPDQMNTGLIQSNSLLIKFGETASLVFNQLSAQTITAGQAIQSLSDRVAQMQLASAFAQVGQASAQAAGDVFNLSIQSNAQTEQVQQSFELMRAQRATG